jgi:ParB family chromosome partitioning protein
MEEPVGRVGSEEECPFCGGATAPREPARGQRVRCRCCHGWTFAGLAEPEARPSARRGLLGSLLALLRKRSWPRRNHLAGRPLVREMPIESIRVSEVVPRHSVDLQRQKALERSVARFGVVVPLVARPARGSYELVAGHRRLLAARVAGLATIPVVIRPLSAAEAEVYRHLENCSSEPPGPLEEAEGFERLFLLSPRLEREELCRRLGLSPAWLEDRLSLLSAPPVVREAVAQRLLDIRSAKAVSMLGSAEEMLRWIERLSSGESSLRDLEARLSDPGASAPLDRASQPVETGPEPAPGSEEWAGEVLEEVSDACRS